jgi:hypothetical protein
VGLGIFSLAHRAWWRVEDDSDPPFGLPADFFSETSFELADFLQKACFDTSADLAFLGCSTNTSLVPRKFCAKICDCSLEGSIHTHQGRMSEMEIGMGGSKVTQAD